MLYIITTLDECSAIEYRNLIRNLRKQSKGLSMRIVALYGDLEKKTRNEFARLTDDSRCFKEMDIYRHFETNYGAKLVHPLGKLAKLFFAREYIAQNVSERDLILFLDPDVFVQRPIREFVKLAQGGKVLFGHELAMLHSANQENARLAVAERFDKTIHWKNTYTAEINTGVNLSFATDFLRLTGDFEDFVRGSGYFNILDQVPDDLKWHDQDFFRYFYRKTQRSDIAVLDMEKVFTSTFGAAKCIYYDSDACVYRTVWDDVPYIVHFAGGSLVQIPRLKPEKNLRPAPEPVPLKRAAEPEKRDRKNGTPISLRPEIILEPELHAFPMTSHAVYFHGNTRNLVERWIRKTPHNSRILLICETDCIEKGRKLKEIYPQIVDVLEAPPELLAGQAPAAFAARLSSQGAIDSIAIPAPVQHHDVEFLPGNYTPALGRFFNLFRGLWRAGVRRAALLSYAGVKVIKMPWMLDGFVNRHKGQRCFVVGNGPSLNEIDMTLLKNEITFGSNRCYMGYENWGLNFTYWGLLDRLQVEEYGPEYEANVSAHTTKFFPFEYLNMLEFENACPVNFNFDHRPPYKFSGKPDVLYLGFTVTHMMMQIAVIMGCNPIYLIGCDHRYNLSLSDDNKRQVGSKNAQVWTAADAKKPTHFSEKYTEGEEEKIFVTPKPERMERAFEVARKWCKGHGIKVYNATPNTGLKVFPLADYDRLFTKKRPGALAGLPDTKRIVFCGINQSEGFSGGRYHAWLTAEAAAERGWEVSYVTNNIPSFYKDFDDKSLFPAHDKIKVHLCNVTGKNNVQLPDIPCDILVVVPHGNSNGPFYRRALEYAAKHKARVALLNFESPNWFNALSPQPREVKRWDGWKLVSESSSLVFSLAAEGSKWAREFYDTAPPATQFDHLWPTINARVADAVGKVPKEKRILILTRFAHSEHKGGSLVPQLFCEAMRGYTAVFMVGIGTPDDAYMDNLKKSAAKYGISIDILMQLSEVEKWREMKRASLVLFPSFFEGFGLPPVEAQYAGTPCIAFDLPVLREISGDNIFYVPPGDIKAMREKIADVLPRDCDWSFLKDRIETVARFEDFSSRFDALFTRVLKEGFPVGHAQW